MNATAARKIRRAFGKPHVRLARIPPRRIAGSRYVKPTRLRIADNPPRKKAA